MIKREAMAVRAMIRRVGVLSAIVSISLAMLAGFPRTASAQLLGDSTVNPAGDTDAAGQSEAFQTTASSTGSFNTLNVYVDSSSQSTQVIVGLYSDVNGHPGSLLVQGSTANPAAGAWNVITVTPTQVTAGVTYWIAVLGTGGTLAFRDHCCGGGSRMENSAQSNLSSLPATWQSGKSWNDGPASAFAGTAAPPPPPDTVGQWSSVMNWPLVAIHSIALRTGKVLLMDGWTQPNPTQVFDPATVTLTSAPNPFGLDIFCSAVVTLADGRVMVVGGSDPGTHSIKAVTVFDPASSTWTRAADMNMARWYATATELGDGRIVAISGQITQTTWADTPEIYDPATDRWTLLSGINTSQVHEEEYPLSFLQPNGKIFTIAPMVGLSFLLDANAQTWTPAGGTLKNGSATMYRPGKILYSGGGTPLTGQCHPCSHQHRPYIHCEKG